MSAHTVCSLLQVSVHRDFSAVRDEAMKMIQSAFTLLDQEFQKLDRYMYMFVYLCSQELTWPIHEIVKVTSEENRNSLKTSSGWLQRRPQKFFIGLATPKPKACHWLSGIVLCCCNYLMWCVHVPGTGNIYYVFLIYDIMILISSQLHLFVAERSPSFLKLLLLCRERKKFMKSTDNNSNRFLHDPSLITTNWIQPNISHWIQSSYSILVIVIISYPILTFFSHSLWLKSWMRIIIFF